MPDRYIIIWLATEFPPVLCYGTAIIKAVTVTELTPKMLNISLHPVELLAAPVRTSVPALLLSVKFIITSLPIR
jgi:hypothetical protein